MEPTPTYRADIDGLRAVAVLLVLLYHLGVSRFRGGFIGVDVFFVISGYLITQQIIVAQSAGRFSLHTFFLKRFRRLFPALLVTVTATAIASVLILRPTHVGGAIWSAAFSLVGVSNFLFWAQSGYFDAAAIFKPLLHTWSLAVEAQFYLLWPFLVLAAVGSIHSKWLGVAAVLFVAAALGASIIWVWLDPSGAFYLVPARIFEFAVGGALVFFDGRRLRRRLLESLILVCGLILILLPALTYRSTMPFPGIAALLPCLGACMVIFAGRSAVGSTLLANPVSALIGRASYSIYLVHWPLIVLVGYGLGGRLSLELQIGITVATLVLAFAQYRLIEMPFRISDLPRVHRQVFRATACIALLGLATGMAAGDRIWSWRYQSDIAMSIDPQIAATNRVYTWHLLRASDRPFAPNGKPKVLVIGDSQAGDLINIIDRQFGGDIDLRSIPGQAACQILSREDFYNENPDDKRQCWGRNQRILNDPRVAEADTIVLAFLWRQAASEFMQSDVAALKERGAGSVMVAGIKTQYGSGMDIVSEVGSLAGIESFAARHLSAETIAINDELSSNSGSYLFLDIMDAICTTEHRCKVVDDGGTPLFYDPVHLTTAGYQIVQDSGVLEGIVWRQNPAE